jgi:putative ABC transport system substrate-binding protein
MTFSIFDCRFWIRKEKQMHKTFRIRFGFSCSDNRKSKIENLKWVGIYAIALTFAFGGAVVQAQQPKMHRIGVIMPGGPIAATIDGLRQGLADLGLHEGKQYTLTIKDTQGDVKATEEAAKNFEREKVSLIYAIASSVITAAKNATQSVPIVFCIGSDPVTAKLVDSFAQPGGRLTGVHYLARDLTAKRLEILKEILPRLSRVVTFYDPGRPVPTEGAKLGREEAQRLGLKFVERHVTSVDELRKALQALKPGEADAFFYTADAIVISQAQLIIDTAKAKKIPTMFHEQTLVAKGALASYGQNYYQVGWVSAKHVQQVLNGNPPKDLKIETVDNVDLAINLQTAKQLGLTIPAQVLARASKVIK